MPIVFKKLTYVTVQNLWLVVAKQKLEKRYDDRRLLRVECQADPSPPDTNGFAKVRVTLRLIGPQATQAKKLLDDSRQVQNEYPAPAYFLHHDKQQALPHVLECVANCRKGDRKLLVSVLLFPGEASPDWNALACRIERVVVDGDSTAREQLPPGRGRGAYYGRGNRASQLVGARLPARRQQSVAAEEAQARRSDFSAPCYQHLPPVVELLRLDPHEAAQRLASAFKEDFGGEANASPEQWLDFLRYVWEAEKHYVLSILARYKLHRVRLSWSSEIKGVAVIQLERGAQPLSERRPSIMPNDTVILSKCGSDEEELRFTVFLVQPESVLIHIAGEKCEKRYDPRAAYDVSFDPIPFTIRCEKLQDATLGGTGGLEFLRTKDPCYSPMLDESAVPTAECVADPCPNIIARTDRGRGGSRGRGRGRGEQAPPARAAPTMMEAAEFERVTLEPLDGRQRKAAYLVLRPLPGMQKLFIDGGAGTGKTETMCRVIACLLQSNPDARVAVVSPSNSATDVAARRLQSILGYPDPSDAQFSMMRLFSSHRHPLLCPPELLPFSNLYEPVGPNRPLSPKPYCDIKHQDRFDIKSAANANFEGRRVVFTTTSVASILSHARPAFTHLFVDEVAQATLCETLIPLAAVRSPKLVVFCGDPQQREPQAICFFTRRWIKLTAVSEKFAYRTCPRIVLDSPHRVARTLMGLPGAALLSNRTVAAPDRNADWFMEWPGFRGKAAYGSRFIHVPSGEEKDGTSWKNGKEGAVIVNLVLNLLSSGCIEAKNIVVLSQYRGQRCNLQFQLQRRGLKGVGVKNLEQCIGDECDVALVSLTRCEQDESLLDKRELHTAKTRARRLCIFVGDARFLVKLGTRSSWPHLLDDMIKNHAVEGYDCESKAWLDKEHFVPLEVAAPIVVPEVDPRSPSDARSKQRVKRLPVEDVMNSPNYFIGTVVAPKSWEEGLEVSDPVACGSKVLIETETISGIRKDYVFPGDLVAVQIAERARWRPAAVPAGWLPCRSVPFPPGPSELDLAMDARPYLVDDFSHRSPPDLSSTAGVQPVGTIVGVLERALAPLVVGDLCHTKSDLRLRPRSLALPELEARYLRGETPVEQCGPCVTRLERPDGGMPFYQVLATQTLDLREQLSRGGSLDNYDLPSSVPESLTSGATPRPIDFPLQPYPCYFLPGRLGGFLYEAGVLTIFLPTAIWRLMDDPQVEKFTAATPLKPIPENHIFDDVNDDPKGAHFDAIRLRFKLKLKPPTCEPLHEPLEFVPAFATDGVEPTKVAAKIAGVLRQARGAMNDEYCLSDDSNNEATQAVIEREFGYWVNYAAAAYLWGTMPLHSLLQRRSATRIDADDSTLLLPPQLWIPQHVDSNQFGSHLESGFEIYTPACDRSYVGVIIHRLLLIASRIANGGTAKLHANEKKLVCQLRFHAARINAFTAVCVERHPESVE